MGCGAGTDVLGTLTGGAGGRMGVGADSGRVGGALVGMAGPIFSRWSSAMSPWVLWMVAIWSSMLMFSRAFADTLSFDAE